MNDRLVELAMNIHHFNQDVMELNIKYIEQIEKDKDAILDLETERDILKSKLSETKADIKYLIEYGVTPYIKNKYIRGDNNEEKEN